MATFLRFRMSGQEFAFEVDRELTADDVWALDEIGMTVDDVAAAFTGAIEESVAGKGHLGLKILCALAFLTRRREDPSIRWAEFSRTIEPGTFEVIVEPPNRAARRAADRASTPDSDSVGAALAETGAAKPRSRKPRAKTG